MKYSVEMVQQRLRRLVLDGYFPAQQPLPSIQKLSEVFGVSLVTMHAAIHALADAGLVEARHGSGVFVKYPLKWNSRGASVVLLTSLESRGCAETPYPAVALRMLRDRLKALRYRLRVVSLKELADPDVAGCIGDPAPAGVILHEIESTRLIEEIRGLGVPLISMDFDLTRFGVPSVAFDNLAAGFDAARHLIKLGHRRIGFVRIVYPGLTMRLRAAAHAPVDSVTEDRMRGYELALRDAGLPTLFLEKHNDKPLELDSLLARKEAPTALVCLGGELALEAAATLLRLNRRVPADVSLLALAGGKVRLPDGTSLTALTADCVALGRRAAALFHDVVQKTSSRRVLLPLALAAGESTAAAAPC